MSDDHEETLADTVEKLRAEKFSHLDKMLVREILRLHGDLSESSNTPASAVSALIRKHSGKDK